ncbi:MAG: replication-relaxation family protein [Candidatus Brocadiae bacterium]|nr:replication-relaxation family protein [Candidatus Brocadiia bacterium]
MDEIPPQQREQQILEYLKIEGYALSKSIVAHLKAISPRGTSIQNVRKLLQKLKEQAMVEYREIPDTQEHVYFLTDKAFASFGLDAHQLKKIPFQHIRHYWTVRMLEKMLSRDIAATEYQMESTNEFHDDENRLLVKFQERGNTIQLRSDAEIRISKNEEERLCMRVEIDMGTESISSTLRSKWNNYHLYFQSSQISKDYITRPLYMLFVTPQARIANICHKFKKHEAMPYIFFLPMENLQPFLLDLRHQEDLDRAKVSSDLRKDFRSQKKKLSASAHIQKQEDSWLIEDQENAASYLIQPGAKQLFVYTKVNLFSDAVLLTHEGRHVSLFSLTSGREFLLSFHSAVKTATKHHPRYDIQIQTIFSMPAQNPFFPMLIPYENRHCLWQPHGYLKIRKKHENNEPQDILLALIFSASNSPLTQEAFRPYENFLAEETLLSKITALPIYYGCLVLVQTQPQIEQIQKILENSKIKPCTRFLLPKDCLPDRIFDQPVWRTAEGQCLTFFEESRDR